MDKINKVSFKEYTKVFKNCKLINYNRYLFENYIKEVRIKWVVNSTKNIL